MLNHAFRPCRRHYSVAVLTQENGIAATLGGSGCHPDFDVYSVDNCTVVVFDIQEDGSNVTRTETCDVIFADDVPGSNLYFFSVSIESLLLWCGLMLLATNEGLTHIVSTMVSCVV